MIDLELLSITLPRANKDAHRIGLFMAAVAKRSAEMELMSPERLVAFVEESSRLIYAWIARSQKLQFPIDLFRDPFRELREATRQFALKWSLDQTFIDSMN